MQLQSYEATFKELCAIIKHQEEQIDDLEAQLKNVAKPRKREMWSLRALNHKLEQSAAQAKADLAKADWILYPVPTETERRLRRRVRAIGKMFGVEADASHADSPMSVSLPPLLPPPPPPPPAVSSRGRLKRPSDGTSNHRPKRHKGMTSLNASLTPSPPSAAAAAPPLAPAPPTEEPRRSRRLASMRKE